MIGVSSGLLLDTVGGWTPDGSWRWIWATLAWTSWTARSMLRSMSNVAVTRAELCLDCDVISRTPLTWASTSSTGLTIPVSMSSGDAPGHDTLTVTAGFLKSAYWLTPNRHTAIAPNWCVPS